MTEIVDMIKDVGFPIFIAVYMVVNNNVTQKKTNTILAELKTLISQKCMRGAK
jgi:hypothetical protein